MRIDPNPREELARLAAARDEAWQRYTQHLACIRLRNSRWCAALSHGRSAFRRHLLSIPVASLRAIPDAH